MTPPAAPSGDPAALDGLLQQSAVALDVHVPDWRAAIEESGRLLVEVGSTRPEYTQQMLDAIDRFGPYIVIAPGIALAHAQASDVVLQTGLSWLRLAEPVEFGHAKNDPVSLVIGLASSNHEEHREALQKVAVLLSDTAARGELDAAQTPQDLIAVINSH